MKVHYYRGESFLGTLDLPQRTFPRGTTNYFCSACGERWARVVADPHPGVHNIRHRACSPCGIKAGYFSYWNAGTITEPPEFDDRILEPFRFTKALPRGVLIAEIIVLTTNLLNGRFNDVY